MNNRELNKYETLGRLVSLYENEKESFAGLPAIEKAFGDIKSAYKEIQLNEKVIQQGTKGLVNSKDNSQEQIIQMGLVFAGALYAYAVDKSDTGLITFSDISSKTFAKMRDSQIPIAIDGILDKVEELGDSVTEYGLPPEKRSAGRALLEDYIAKYDVLDNGKTSKKSARQNIISLLEKADAKLKVLDKLMLNIKESNSGLYAKYVSAKQIIDKAGTHKTAGDSTATTTTPAT